MYFQAAKSHTKLQSISMKLSTYVSLTNANSKIKYGLYDTIWVKKKEDILIIDPFMPSNMNFQTILMPKVNLAKILSEKKLVPQNH